MGNFIILTAFYVLWES